MASIDIVGMIRSRREARAANIEELAHRLAKGEAIPPEEIETWLERTGTDEEMLQDRIESIERRTALLAKVAAGAQAQKKIEKLHAEIDKAFAVVTEAQEKYSAVRVKHADALALLEQEQTEANRAAEALLEPRNLAPVDRDRLAQARKAASESAVGLAEHGRSIPELRASVEEADAMLAEAEELTRQYRGDRGAADALQRAKNAVSARNARLKAAEEELPKKQAAARAAEEALRAIEDELRK